MTSDDASLTLKRERGLQLSLGPVAMQKCQKLEVALVFFFFLQWLDGQGMPQGHTMQQTSCDRCIGGQWDRQRLPLSYKKEKEQLLRARMLWREIRHAHREITWLWTVEMLLCLLELRRWRRAGGTIASRSWVIHGLPTEVIHSNMGPKEVMQWGWITKNIVRREGQNADKDKTMGI